MSSMRYPITPEIHEAIVKIYHGETGDGQIQLFANSVGYPRHSKRKTKKQILKAIEEAESSQGYEITLTVGTSGADLNTA